MGGGRRQASQLAERAAAGWDLARADFVKRLGEEEGIAATKAEETERVRREMCEVVGAAFLRPGTPHSLIACAANFTRAGLPL